MSVFSYVIVLYFTIQSALLSDCKRIELSEKKLYIDDTPKTFKLHHSHNINKRDNYLKSAISNKLYNEDLSANTLNITNEYISIYYYDEHCTDNGVQLSNIAACSYRIPTLNERKQILTLYCESVESISCDDFIEDPTDEYNKNDEYEEVVTPDDTTIKIYNETSDTHLNVTTSPLIFENSTVYTNMKNRSNEEKSTSTTEITTETRYEIITKNLTEVTDVTTSSYVREITQFSETESNTTNNNSNNTTSTLFEYDKTTKILKFNTTIEDIGINTVSDKEKQARKMKIRMWSEPINKGYADTRKDHSVIVILASTIAAAVLASSAVYFAARKIQMALQSNSYRIPQDSCQTNTGFREINNILSV